MYRLQHWLKLEENASIQKSIAWQFGPAIPEAYRYYEEYGRNNIPNQDGYKTIKLDDKTLRMNYAQPVEIDYTIKRDNQKCS